MSLVSPNVNVARRLMTIKSLFYGYKHVPIMGDFHRTFFGQHKTENRMFRKSGGCFVYRIV